MSRVVLTDEQRERVLAAISAAETSDDSRPADVVANRYNGDWNAYFIAMAKWHGVLIK